jgi:hypothetical protein
LDSIACRHGVQHEVLDRLDRDCEPAPALRCAETMTVSKTLDLLQSEEARPFPSPDSRNEVGGDLPPTSNT